MARDTSTWRELLLVEMSVYGDSFDAIESTTLADADLDREFDGGYGCVEGVPFTVWTKTRVYFPIMYDGAEWAGSVSRNPDGKPTDHQGGG